MAPSEGFLLGLFQAFLNQQKGFLSYISTVWSLNALAFKTNNNTAKAD